MEIGLRQKTKAEIKIIIVGNAGTGKTSICHRWMEGTFLPIYKATIMVEFKYKIMELKGNLYKIQIWDIGGQDKNKYASKVLTKGAHGLIVVCDAQNEESLDHVMKWKNTIDENQKFVDGNNLPCILLQNKCDLLDESERTDESSLKRIAQEKEFLNAFKTSAKDGTGINEAMDYLVLTIAEKLERFCNENNVPINKERSSITLNKPTNENTKDNLKEKGCC